VSSSCRERWPGGEVAEDSAIMLAVASFAVVWGLACLSPLVAMFVAGFFYARSIPR
jgi:hypothetical protein